MPAASSDGMRRRPCTTTVLSEKPHVHLRRLDAGQLDRDAHAGCRFLNIGEWAPRRLRGPRAGQLDHAATPAPIGGGGAAPAQSEANPPAPPPAPKVAAPRGSPRTKRNPRRAPPHL